MKNKRNIIFAIGITVALISGFWFGQIFLDQKEDTASTPIRAIVPETPRKLAIPALQQGDGSSFDMASLQGKWNLLFFGYTNCPDICPTTLNTVAQAKKKLEQTGLQFPQVVFISVDPERDNVKVLGEYVRYFDKDFIGATGEEKLLRAITVQMNSMFMIQQSENENEYQVGHSLNLVLINPSVELVAVLRPPHSVESILDALQHFQKKVGSLQ
ncbi:MAG: SCO family protein [Gammaproteobacteria bacterium]|nr:SCO family protein [Gammaproteobacteria bacterium]